MKTKMRFPVTVTIPATLTIEGTIDGEDEASAKKKAVAEAKKLAKEFAGKPLLRGVWPEAFNRAAVEAAPEPGVKVTVEVREP